MLTKVQNKGNPTSLFQNIANPLIDDTNETQRRILIEKIKKGEVKIPF